MATAPVALSTDSLLSDHRPAGPPELSAEPGLAERLTKDNIHTVEVAFTDTVGALRGKQVPVRHFHQDNLPDVFFCSAALAWDVECELFPGVDFASLENGYPDLKAKLDPSTYTPLPWRPGNALIMANLFSESGEVVHESPRQVLKRVLAEATALGYRAKVGAELEFYLVDAEYRPVFDGIRCYSLEHATRLGPVLDRIRQSLESIGIGVEASGTEYGPAQVEINLDYTDALQVADSTIVFKRAAKEIAREHGFIATFMAKPWEDQSGSSFHVHQSLWSLDGDVNLFAASKELALKYAAGLVSRAPEFTALLAPTVNSYKRFASGSFAPTTASWSEDNRTVATRLLLGHGDGSRIEYRAGGADANPYLVIAANIAAGLDGLKNGLSLPERTAGNAYNGHELRLPDTFSHALDLFEASDAAGQAFGKAFVRLFTAVGRHDISANQSAVTDWERRRYLENV